MLSPSRPEIVPAGGFAEWFPNIDEDKAVAALGKDDDGACLAGKALNGPI